MNVVRPILVTKACKRYFPLPHRPYPGDQWGMVAEIVSEQGFKTVILRSNVQVIIVSCVVNINAPFHIGFFILLCFHVPRLVFI